MAELKCHIVVANLPDLRVPHFLSTVISAAAHAKRPRLIIILLSPFFNGSDASASIAPDISHTDKWHEIHRILTFTYVQATKIAQDLGNPLMDVDVLLKGNEDDLNGDWGSEADGLYCVQGDRPPASIPPSLSALPIVYVEPAPETAAGPLQSSVPSPSQTTPPFYPVVVCGGTFDHLHPGHKILLSLGAWIASEKLIVGITDDPLLVKKAFPSVLESIDVRTNKVRKFLAMFRPGLLYDLVPIVDVYGPTAWDPNIQALVVSKESIDGAKAIATRREQQGLPALQTFVIDVVSPHHPSLSDEDMEMLKSTKISSTSIREYIVNKKIREEGMATGK